MSWREIGPLGLQIPLEPGAFLVERGPGFSQDFLLLFQFGDEFFTLGHLLAEPFFPVFQVGCALAEFPLQLRGRRLDLLALLLEKFPLLGDLIFPLVKLDEVPVQMLGDAAGFDKQFVLFADYGLGAGRIFGSGIHPQWGGLIRRRVRHLICYGFRRGRRGREMRSGWVASRK